MQKCAHLGDVVITTLSGNIAAIYTLARQCNTLVVGLPLSTQVDVYGGVMDSNSSLVNCSQFVTFGYDGEVRTSLFIEQELSYILAVTTLDLINSIIFFLFQWWWWGVCSFPLINFGCLLTELHRGSYLYNYIIECST